MSLVTLSRNYVCHLGAPVLTAVDTAIFRTRYFARCMDCGFCHDACCDHGVDIDVENAERLMAAPQAFRDRVGVPVQQWFAGSVVADTEFPGGAHLRTAVRDGACAFRDRNGRGCLIHAWCLETGIDYHRLKPLVSTLFPVTFEHGVLRLSDEAADGTLVCAGGGPSCYDGARTELLHYFGGGLVAELDSLSGLP
ncbi:MAG TPA: hypothetical protein VFS01_12225 [Rhizomicrobium sp.]|jgi:NAD-dependent dihydropyrimidine dehydrogenase PreA subunit|nr:hypothetical protein [Rhizomicrobium sp.]